MEEKVKPSDNLIKSIIDYFDENERVLTINRVNEWLLSPSTNRYYQSVFMTQNMVCNIFKYDRQENKAFIEFPYYPKDLNLKKPLNYEMEISW